MRKETLKETKLEEDSEEILINNTRESCIIVEISEAKAWEIKNWKNDSVYREEDNEGQEGLSDRAAVTEKKK